MPGGWPTNQGPYDGYGESMNTRNGAPPPLPAKPAAYARPMGPRPPPSPERHQTIRNQPASPATPGRGSPPGRAPPRRVPVGSISGTSPTAPYSNPSTPTHRPAPRLVVPDLAAPIDTQTYAANVNRTPSIERMPSPGLLDPTLQGRMETYRPFGGQSRLPYPIDSKEEKQLEVLQNPLQYSPGGVPVDLPYADDASTISVTESVETFDDWRNNAATTPSVLLPPLPDSRYIPKAGDGSLVFSLDLPEIPPMAPARPLFSAEELTIADLQACKAIWSLSEIAKWIHWLVSTLDADFSIASTKLALVKLFTFDVPTLSWTQAESFASQIILSLQQQGFIVMNDESPDAMRDNMRDLTIDFDVAVSGVFTLLCGHGCYAGIKDRPGQCYSSKCMREERIQVIDTKDGERRTPSGQIPPSSGKHGPLEMDWAVYWGFSPPEVEEMDKKIAKRQYALHELIQGEALYVRDLSIYLEVYGQLEHVVPSVMTKQSEFCSQVFGRIRDVVETNKVMLAAMRTRQDQQGPYVEQVADIVLDWVRIASDIYGKYADDYLLSDSHLRQELSSSPRLSQWMAETSQDPRLKGIPHSFYFSRVIPRLARYGLLLGAIHKLTPEFSPDYELLQQAMDAVGALARDCDARVAKVQTRVDVQNLKAHIVFRDESVSVDLKLGDKKRKLIKRGSVLRRSGHKMEWLPTDILLLDNFLILSKPKEGANGTAFYITKAPIPLDLLVIEAAHEDPVQKVASRLTFTTTERPKSKSKEGEGESVTTIEQPKDLLYPIRITHLGIHGGSYVLYSSSEIQREQWKDAITEAKRAISASAFSRNSEPFRLRLLSDSFAYPASEAPALPLPTPSTVLHRALGSKKPPYVVARSRVNCVVNFGPDLFFAGFDWGIWFMANKKTKEWTKCLDLPKVTDLRVVEGLNLLLVLSAGHLVWYRLDEVVNRGITGVTDKRSPPLGHRLNRQRKVIAFEIAYLKDRLVVVYQQQETSSSKTIKIIEPINCKVTPAAVSPIGEATKLLESGTISTTVDYFRETDRYTSPYELLGFTPFHHCIITHSVRGFEYVSLEVKVPKNIPGEHAVFVSGINTSNTMASVVSALAGSNSSHSSGKALSIFRASANALVLCYEHCCLFCDNNGAPTSAPITWFVGAAERVAYHSPYLILVGPELVEIRKIEIVAGRVAPEKAKLLQVITGKDIHLLGNIEGQIRLAMAHPTAAGRQLVVELVGNEYVLIDDNSSLVTL